MDADGSNPQVIAYRVGTAYWSPNGDEIALAKPSGAIRMVDADGSDSRVVIRNSKFISFSPDASQVAFERSHLEDFVGRCYDFGVVDADGTDDHLLIDDSMNLDFHGWTADSSQVFVSSQDREALLMDPEGGAWRDLGIPGWAAELEPHGSGVTLPALPANATPISYSDHSCNVD